MQKIGTNETLLKTFIQVTSHSQCIYSFYSCVSVIPLYSASESSHGT
ncbi:hypothetical protein FAEPRAA2165_03084 [Faecalibacterium duncaniae]|uniref:Uncharacterized protein n=1 Tax=Faecalibacterium duncaniae (strain DSM 17677 / JCM 31915 / A2-165) TaxID=411483 RepID=C7H9T0_FAED2|nr:hypothetical protein FAEPRAA2165_03084 [Faecalibacterium duncaniae]